MSFIIDGNIKIIMKKYVVYTVMGGIMVSTFPSPLPWSVWIPGDYPGRLFAQKYFLP